MGLQFDHNRPIYLQIMEHIYGQICRSELRPGAKLPSVRALAVEAGVNPNTVSRTFLEMERQNIVVSKRGQGTFVTEDKTVLSQLRNSMAEEKADEFILTMNQIGFSNKEIIALMKEKMDAAEEGTE